MQYLAPLKLRTTITGLYSLPDSRKRKGNGGRGRSPPKVYSKPYPISQMECVTKLFLQISPSHMFDKALSTTLHPKKEKVFSALVEVFLLKNSFKQSGNFNFLIFPCEAFGFII